MTLCLWCSLRSFWWLLCCPSWLGFFEVQYRRQNCCSWEICQIRSFLTSKYHTSALLLIDRHDFNLVFLLLSFVNRKVLLRLMNLLSILFILFHRTPVNIHNYFCFYLRFSLDSIFVLKLHEGPIKIGGLLISCEGIVDQIDKLIQKLPFILNIFVPLIYGRDLVIWWYFTDWFALHFSLRFRLKLILNIRIKLTRINTFGTELSQVIRHLNLLLPMKVVDNVRKLSLYFFVIGFN